MKILKALFSRMTIIIFLLLLQLVTTALLLYYLEEYYFAVSFAFFIFSFLALLHIINREMSPDLKIPWIVFVLVMPTFGVVAYVMFSQSKVSFRQRKLYKATINESKKVRANCKNTEVDLSELGDKRGQAEYLLGNPLNVIYKNTDTKYFASGEDFFADLICELQKAEKFIFMEYFIIKRGKMWNSILAVLEEKAKQGVDVRVMYDDLGSIAKLPMNYPSTLKKRGLKCCKFNRFIPIVSGVHNNRNHRKITVIDGKVAYTGGVNLSDEYINDIKPFGYWKDTVLKLKGEGVQAMTFMFLQSYGMQSKPLDDMQKFVVNESQEGEGYVIPFGTGPRPIYPDYVGKEVLLNLINGAKRYVYITTPYLIIDHELKNAIQTASKRGVDVRIVMPGIPDKKMIFTLSRSNYACLIKSNVKIYEYFPGFVHSKSIIVDDEVGMISSINLDYRSLVHHYECGVWMYKASALKELKEDFDSIFEECMLFKLDDAQMSPIQRVFCGLIKIFAPML